MKRVVVTGCGIVSSVGVDTNSCWSSLLAAKSGIGRITRIEAEGFASQIAGEVKSFNPPSFISPKDIKRFARFVQFALGAAEEALKSSGLDLSKIDPYSAGAIIGSGIGSLETIEREYKVFLEKGPKRISPFLIPRLITNEAAGNVAIHFNLKGINFCTVTACASGAHAIGESFRTIQQGRAKLIISGGSEACITYLGLGGFCSLKALSTRNDEPKRASRPFDRERDGFVIAEGAGIVVLEELEHAKRRRAPIYAEMCGYGSTCDAYHITAPVPTGEPAARAMEIALKEGGVRDDERIYINAHGTSTPLNDKIETKAIKLALGNSAKEAYISSTKSMTGHTLGASGAIEFIISCLSVKNKIIPPTINYENPDPECDLNYTPNEPRELDVGIALSNSLGFGGHNAALLVKEFKS